MRTGSPMTRVTTTSAASASLADARPRPLAVSMGEPGGVGPDIILAAWMRREAERLPAFFVLADPDCLARRAAELGLAVPLASVAPEEAASAFARALPVLPLEARASGRAGHADAADAPAVIEAIDRAVELVVAGRARALVTAPVQKASLYAAGFAHPGQTEYLGALAERHTGEARRAVMMIAGPGLRVVPVTIHVPFVEVPRLLTEQLIVETGMIVADDLARRFRAPRPRLVLCGLNPHAGEDGMLGREEKEIIAPAAARLRAAGIDASGPHAADTLFHAAARARYDAVLGMYHDQVLIPIKTLAFDEGVNVTLGLPFVRTSPDHGTALALAGTGQARPTSLICALRLADALAGADVER